MYILQVGTVGQRGFKVSFEESSTNKMYLFKKFQNLMLPLKQQMSAVLVNKTSGGILRKGVSFDLNTVKTIV